MIGEAERELELGFDAREKWALEEVYERYSRTFFAAALSVLKNPEDAQDCVHEVLLRLWQRPHAFSPERGSLKAFIAVCIRNEALSRLRRARRAPEIEQRYASYFEEEVFEVPDHVERNRLMVAIRSLPEPQRKALLMSFFQHKTHREIAAELGEPMGTIKSRLSAAMRRLHTLVAEDQFKGQAT